MYRTLLAMCGPVKMALIDSTEPHVASNVRYIAYLLRGTLKVSIYGKVRCQDVPPPSVALDTLVLQAPNGYNQHAIFGTLVGVNAYPYERHEECCFFYICDCFFIVPQRKCFFVGNQIYSRAKCDAWLFFDVTLDRFLM